MQLYILDEDYSIIGMVDTYESALWVPKYNDVGECEIYIPCETDYLPLLKNGNYIYRYDDDMFCKIKCFEIKTDIENGNYIICTGIDIADILSDRVIQSQTVFSGTVGQFIERLLLDNVINAPQASRLITNFRVDTSNFSEFNETIEVSAFGDDLLQRIITTCKSHNIGFRVRYDISVGHLIFTLYRGANKASAHSEEYVEFSPQFANIISSNYKDDERNYKNVACVRYKDVDENIKVIWVYIGEEPRGEERREKPVDATNINRNVTYDELLEMFPNVRKDTQNNAYYITMSGSRVVVANYEIKEATETEEETETITITDYTVEKLAVNMGKDALSQSKRQWVYTGNVDTLDTYTYKVDYNIGDIVKVINEYGMETEARVTEVFESDDNESGYVVEPKFEYLN
jgi:hypothetical protein